MLSDIYAYVDTNSTNYTVYLLTASDSISVTAAAPTIDAAVTSLVQAAPPDAVKGVFVTNCAFFEKSWGIVEALKNAGYTNIEACDLFSLSMSSIIYNLHFNCAVGDGVFVYAGVGPICTWGLTVLQKCDDNWKLVVLHEDVSEALDRYPSFRHVVYNKRASDEDKALVRKWFPGCQLHATSIVLLHEFKVRFVQNRITKGNLNGFEVLPFFRYGVLIDFGDQREIIPMNCMAPPCTITKEIDVGDAPLVEIRVDEYGEPVIKGFKFKSAAFRTIEITVDVDKTLVPQVSIKTIATRESNTKSTTVNEQTTLRDDDVDKTASTVTLPNTLSQLNLDPLPTTVLTFTSDNRVLLIQADQTYTGTKEVLAYVRLQDGKAPEVGQRAFDALKKHADSVYYDVTRLLAVDFDPDYPHPSWQFKTTRDANGKLLVHGGNNIVIHPIVLLGIIVKRILQYIRDKKNAYTELKDISQLIGVHLVLVSRDDKVDKVRSITTLPNESQLNLDPLPTTILTFTSDNRVLIQADKSFTGTKEILAYVRLQDGKAPQVGKLVFDELKRYPYSIYYDITRLLAIDFEPAYPNPSWRFKTSRGVDGKIAIRGGDNNTTLLIVLFGVVVNSTLKYIKEHQKSEITELGIRLPSGCVISDIDLRDVEQRICVKLVLLVD